MAAAAPCGGAGGPVGGGGPAALRTFADAGPSDLATGPVSAFAVPASLPGGLLPDIGDATPGDYRAPIAVAAPTPGGIVPAVGGAGGGGLPGTGVPPVAGDSPTESGVPEPSTWALMLAGVGAMGAALRRRRPGRAGRSRTGVALLGLGADAAGLLPAGQLGAAATTAQAGVKSTKAALLAKAALCVCPPAMLATSVAVAPPVRHAVYAATAPRERARPAAALPCGPDVATIAARRTARRS